MKAIIPIGGRGTRMRPITLSANKHFIPVANKLLIEYPIKTVIAAGVTEIGITYNPGQLEHAQRILGDGSQWGAKFTFILQENPKGLANIVEVAEKFVDGDSFVFHLGDNIFVEGIKEAMDYFEKKKPNGLVTMMHHPQNRRMGVPYFDKKGQMIKYVEKPENPPHDFAVPGVYFADSNFFKCFRGKDRLKPSARGEFEIPDAFQWMIDHGFRVDVVEYKGKWLDPGKFDDWLDTNQYLLDRNAVVNFESKPDEKSKIEGRVSIGKNTIIENSIIRGPVAIGNNVVIKNSYIGPYTSIYHDCSIENTDVENSVLMNKVKLQNIMRPIHNSIIGTEAEISGSEPHTHFMSLFVSELSHITL